MKFLFSYQIIVVLDFRHPNWGIIDFLNYYTTTNKNFETAHSILSALKNLQEPTKRVHKL